MSFYQLYLIPPSTPYLIKSWLHYCFWEYSQSNHKRKKVNVDCLINYFLRLIGNLFRLIIIEKK